MLIELTNKNRNFESIQDILSNRLITTPEFGKVRRNLSETQSRYSSKTLLQDSRHSSKACINISEIKKDFQDYKREDSIKKVKYINKSLEIPNIGNNNPEIKKIYLSTQRPPTLNAPIIHSDSKYVKGINYDQNVQTGRPFKTNHSFQNSFVKTMNNFGDSKIIKKQKDDNISLPNIKREQYKFNKTNDKVSYSDGNRLNLPIISNNSKFN